MATNGSKPFEFRSLLASTMTMVALAAISYACLAVGLEIWERTMDNSTVCYGFDLLFDLKDTPEVRLEMLKELTNCTVILGNLDIVGLPPKADLSFLESIEVIWGRLLVYNLNAKRIPLPNLKMIRGNDLGRIFINGTLNPLIGTEGFGFVLLVADNPGLIHLGLNSLMELSMGSPGFLGNPDLCYEERAPWTDIYGDGDFLHYFEGGRNMDDCPCHKNCPRIKGMTNCFGPSLKDCRTRAYSDCHDSCRGSRCFGPSEAECCSFLCSVGCSGPRTDQCFTCKFVGLGDHCYHECPKDKWEMYYTLGHRCVAKCPEDHVLLGDDCVRFCEPNFMEFKGRCVPCEEGQPCRRRCPGTGLSFLTSTIYANFTKCTTIAGNLYIADKSFRELGPPSAFISDVKVTGLKYLAAITMNMLRPLIDVETITGSLYVDVHRDEFKNLSFLRNLKVIEARTSVNGFTGLMIKNTTMESIGLTSLKEVSRGRIVITLNKDLCYLDGLDLNVLGKSKDHLMENNKDLESCAKENKVCADVCLGGCMGPLESNCVGCKNYEKDRICMGCHVKCLTCHGPCLTDCLTCPKMHLFKDDSLKCVDRCPRRKPVEKEETVNGSVRKICVEEEGTITNKAEGGPLETAESGFVSLWLIFSTLLCLTGLSSLLSLKRAKPPKADVQKGEKVKETQSSKENLPNYSSSH